MKSGRTRVLASLRAVSGREDDLRTVLEGLIEPTRAEAGCLHYELWQNQSEPAEFTFVEEWVSREALEAHGETEHIRKGRERMRELLAAPMDLRIYDRVR
jgi:quinol monooxygenase YgiN